MQSSLQHTNLSLPSEYSYLNCPFQTVGEFLHHCNLDQYLNIFLAEGFDSITSLLEITEEDMIEMSVKRGHRRLIQREIATIKGISRDQPLVTNMINTKYHDILSNTNLKIEQQRRSNPNLNTPQPYNGNPTSYDVIGLTSPRSMNSGVGSSTGGTSSSSGPVMNLRSRMDTPNTNNPIQYHHHHHHHRKSATPPTTSNNKNNIASLIDQSMSSNDDNDSIDTNESVPSKRKYRRHAKPDRNAPVKPPSAYIMFSNDARAELKNQNLSFAEVAKIVGDQWKNLSHARKQHYERMAMRAKDEYLAALEQYRHTPQYKRYKEYLDEFKQKQDSNTRIHRKRSKQPSPGSGSIADSSSNGNSNGNGSSGSGSADAYSDKESRQQNTDSGYASQSYWNTDAVMRGMLPIEFVQNTPNKEVDDESDGSTFKRRSPRFDKTKN